MCRSRTTFIAAAARTAWRAACNPSRAESHGKCSSHGHTSKTLQESQEIHFPDCLALSQLLGQRYESGWWWVVFTVCASDDLERTQNCSNVCRPNTHTHFLICLNLPVRFNSVSVNDTKEGTNVLTYTHILVPMCNRHSCKHFSKTQMCPKSFKPSCALTS